MLLSHSFKQKVDQDLSIYMDERSPCGLYITGHIKIYQYQWSRGNDVTTTNGEVTFGLLSRHKSDNSSPSSTRDKEICQGHMIMR